MRLAIIGAGYVGLVSGVCLAARGHHVTCIDIKDETVNCLNRGEPPIHEEGLPQLLKQVVASGHFRATTDFATTMRDAEGVMIAVGTPSVDGAIDLAYVLEAARQIGICIRNMNRFLPVIVKSTVVPGTTDTVVCHALEESSGKELGQFGLGMNPEFLREGQAVEDFMMPDRIVLGHEDPQTLEFLQALYAPWDCDKLAVNTRTAEMIKYGNNALLALQISAVNEIANLAAAIGGVDAMDVMRGVHLDKRWNPSVDGRRQMPEILTYLVPGCGFGGSCFPKDVQALRTQGKKLGLPMSVLDAVLAVNEAQPAEAIAVLKRAVGDLAGRSCLVLGLAFKPGTDDVRESASLRMIAELLANGAKVHAHDPIATDNFRRAFGPRAKEIDFHDDWQAKIAAADIVIVATRWPEYRELLQHELAGKIVFDARRFFSREELEGAQYLAIGYRAA
jgi:UDPglucose 6-dehydrogenase/GDP-mannose 6-dehydrogenase